MIKNEKLQCLNVVIWLASVFSMIGLMILSSKIFQDDRFALPESAVITIITLAYLYLISGKKTFMFLNNQTGYTVKMLFPTLIFSLIFAFFGVLSVFWDAPALIPDWPVNLLLFAADMFLVGIYEEACFRACACDALLPLLKNTKHPFFLTAMISGLVFGYVHVVSTDFTDLQQTLQFILKIVNLAVSGATFMILYWKTRNLLGLAIVHGLKDFLPDFINHIFLFENTDTSDGYITGNSETTAVYLIQLVFEILCFIYVYKKAAKTLDYQKVLEEWQTEYNSKP